MSIRIHFLWPGLLSLLLLGAAAQAQDEEVAVNGSAADQLAKQLANPIANLISVPLQSTFDFGSGPDGDGFRYTLNIQPIIPFDLTEDWMLITRTIIPVVYQNDEASSSAGDDVFGIGNIVQSFFFSPKSEGKVTWGIGPVINWPTSTDRLLGSDEWGLGPTGVILVVDGPWTYGFLVNHIWGFGDSTNSDPYLVDRPQINATFMQPFASYSLGDGWSLSGNLESTYDWEGHQWTSQLGGFVQKVLQLGDQMVSLQGGPHVYIVRPPDGPDWGLRFTLTLIFPR